MRSTFPPDVTLKLVTPHTFEFVDFTKQITPTYALYVFGVLFAKQL